jgi:hypothetical protein
VTTPLSTVTPTSAASTLGAQGRGRGRARNLLYELVSQLAQPQSRSAFIVVAEISGFDGEFRPLQNRCAKANGEQSCTPTLTHASRNRPRRHCGIDASLSA